MPPPLLLFMMKSFVALISSITLLLASEVSLWAAPSDRSWAAQGCDSVSYTDRALTRGTLALMMWNNIHPDSCLPG